MIFMYSYEPNQTRYNQLFIVFPFFGLPIIMEYFANFYNKKFVKFYNDRVTYYTNKIPEKTIFLFIFIHLKIYIFFGFLNFNLDLYSTII